MTDAEEAERWLALELNEVLSNGEEIASAVHVLIRAVIDDINQPKDMWTNENILKEVQFFREQIETTKVIAGNEIVLPAAWAFLSEAVDIIESLMNRLNPPPGEG